MNKIRICGEWQAIRDLARRNGCSVQKSRELLMAMRNAFEKLTSDVDVFVTKPRPIDITGAHINSQIVGEKLKFSDICELSRHRKTNPNTEILGSIIAATPDQVCKGILVAPDKNLLEGYVKAAEQLAKSDFTSAANNGGYVQFIN